MSLILILFITSTYAADDYCTNNLQITVINQQCVYKANDSVIETCLTEEGKCVSNCDEYHELHTSSQFCFRKNCHSIPCNFTASTYHPHWCIREEYNFEDINRNDIKRKLNNDDIPSPALLYSISCKYVESCSSNMFYINLNSNNNNNNNNNNKGNGNIINRFSCVSACPVGFFFTLFFFYINMLWM
jgi:hypothetical protein